MPKASDFFPSKFYRAMEDFGPKWKGETWTIDHAEAVDFSGDMKLVLYFKDHEQGIVLNKSNTMHLVANLDDDYDKWPGSHVLVETTPRTKPDGSPTRGFVLTVTEVDPDDKIPF